MAKLWLLAFSTPCFLPLVALLLPVLVGCCSQLYL
jgi:hypothetical protein